jgi:hypothetical protein
VINVCVEVFVMELVCKGGLTCGLTCVQRRVEVVLRCMRVINVYVEVCVEVCRGACESVCA